MADEIINTQVEETTPATAPAAAPEASTEAPRASQRRALPPRGGNRDRRRSGGGGGRGGRSRGGDDRRSEFAQKLIGIRRVARVMAGGRRFNFSVAVVLGDKQGRVGVGLGKAADTQLAI